MPFFKLPYLFRPIVPSDRTPGLRRAYLLAAIFFIAVLLISLHRYFVFYTSYDQGLFNQVFWNSLHGRFFQSSLTSNNSISSMADGAIPTVSFLHLGQHLILNFLLWLPLYALYPNPATLIVLQVGLMAVGGLLLYALARHSLSPQLSLWITGGYYAAIAVISPTVANFYEQCQIPLLMFGLLLALEKQSWRWFWVLALLVLGIREDAGIMLFGVGVYLLISRRHPKTGFALCLLSFSYVAIVTSVIMPQISEDNPRLYMAVRFRQFVNHDEPTTLEVLWGMLTNPIALITSIFTPVDRRLIYLVSHWLPVAFVPMISASAWIVSAPPLLSLFAQSGVSALSINLRYALAVVPGLFYGAVLWWSHHPQSFTPRVRRFWSVCIALSIVFTITNNPNRAFSFVIPDSIRPWVFVPIARQWEHAQYINRVIGDIPPDASVSATTHLIPQLSSRREIIRLPALQLRDDRNQVIQMEYAVADIWQLREYKKAFKDTLSHFVAIVPALDKLITTGEYGILRAEDGVVLLKKGGRSSIEALAEWQKLKG
ncbi:DUF2079 domain-containing protein [Phormidesmis sp. 146-33]